MYELIVSLLMCVLTMVQIIGLSGDAVAGDTLTVVDNEIGAKEAVNARDRIVKRDKGHYNIESAKARAFSIADSQGMDAAKETLSISVLVKCDTTGSVEVLRSAVQGLEQSDDTSLCRIDIVHSGVGDVTTSDIASAAAFGAKIIAFNVGCGSGAQAIARKSSVEVLQYGIIYELLDELSRQIAEKLIPTLPGILRGRLLVKKIFNIGKSNKIVGCELIEGRADLQSQVRVMRNSRQVVHTGRISSIRIAKDTVTEVTTVGNECGVALADFLDTEEGDIIEFFSSESGN